jgi:hypothetical protein
LILVQFFRPCRSQSSKQLLYITGRRRGSFLPWVFIHLLLLLILIWLIGQAFTIENRQILWIGSICRLLLKFLLGIVKVLAKVWFRFLERQTTSGIIIIIEVVNRLEPIHRREGLIVAETINLLVVIRDDLREEGCWFLLQFEKDLRGH